LFFRTGNSSGKKERTASFPILQFTRAVKEDENTSRLIKLLNFIYNSQNKTKPERKEEEGS
jgi:hypothetical protein